MTEKSNNEQWIVQVFRRSTGTGWEALQVASRKKNHAATTLVHASLAKKSILLPRLRFRVKLQGDTVVTRRQQSVRVQSNQGVRVLVLVFPTLADCDTFCDVLVRLHPVRQETTTTTMPLAHHLEQDKQSVLFYVARLLYDPEFMSLVRTVEDSVLSSDQGQKMLQDLNALLPQPTNGESNDDNTKTTTTPTPSPLQW